MAVRAARPPAAARVRVFWSNPPRRQLTIVRRDGGREWQRTIGLRGMVAVDEAAAVLGVSVDHVRRVMATGKLPTRASGADPQLVLDDVVEYASDRRLLARSRKVEAAVRSGRQGVVLARDLAPIRGRR